MPAPDLHNPLVIAALFFALLSASIAVWYLLAKPPLTFYTKLILLAGIAVFPISASMSTSIEGYQVTQTQAFCGACHNMTPYTDDAMVPFNEGLAAVHSKNDLFGNRSCYVCHADYGMFGAVTTKIGGMHHVWAYYMTWNDGDKIELYKPFSNDACTHCHSMTAPQWRETPDHKGAGEDLKSNKVSCLGAGCHGPSHPFSKPKEVAAQ